MSLKRRNGKSKFARRFSFFRCVELNVIDCILVSIQPTHALISEKQRRMPKTFEKKRKSAAKMKKKVRRTGLEPAIHRLGSGCAPISATRADDRTGRPPSTNSSLSSVCFFFSVAFSRISMYPAYTLSTRAFFFGSDPCMRPAVKRETKKRAP